MTPPRVLLADSDPRLWGDLADHLGRLGVEVAVETAADRLSERLSGERFDVLLAEVELLGRQVVELARSGPGAPEVLLLDTFGDEGDGAAAMRAGAFDVLPRPASSEQCVLGVQRALEQRRVARENELLRREAALHRGLGRVETRDEAMQRALDLVRSVADTRVSLLIEGESGTGKTLVARALHEASSRADGPFVVVNCGALPDALLESELFGHVKGAFTGAVADREGRFQAAHTGTLFLDEVNSASLDLQVKLLRAIESGEFEPLGGQATRCVDVRVVTASNRDLREEVARGRFRDDLYWRLKVVSVELPPLRRRPADVALLAEAFLTEAAAEHRRPAAHLAPDALAALLAHDWPGNVRELRHAVERAVLVAPGPEVRARHLPPEVAARAAASPERPPSPGADAPAAGDLDAVPLGPLKTMLEVPERRFVERALAACRGSRKRTAELLEVNRGTLFNKMRRYGLMGFPREGAGPHGPDAPR